MLDNGESENGLGERDRCGGVSATKVGTRRVAEKAEAIGCAAPAPLLRVARVTEEGPASGSASDSEASCARRRETDFVCLGATRCSCSWSDGDGWFRVGSSLGVFPLPDAARERPVLRPLADEILLVG